MVCLHCGQHQVCLFIRLPKYVLRSIGLLVMRLRCPLACIGVSRLVRYRLLCIECGHQAIPSTVHIQVGTGGNNTPLVAEPTMAVRRLTPLECERLMGWPDNHTRYKADGTEQADSHRYRQCGNGVASPVAQWIAKHILAI